MVKQADQTVWPSHLHSPRTIVLLLSLLLWSDRDLSVLLSGSVKSRLGDVPWYQLGESSGVVCIMRCWYRSPWGPVHPYWMPIIRLLHHPSVLNANSAVLDANSATISDLLIAVHVQWATSLCQELSAVKNTQTPPQDKFRGFMQWPATPFRYLLMDWKFGLKTTGG